MSYVRSLIASIRVGWARDFGWTNPILGFSLKTIAPIASTMTALTILYIGFRNGVSITPEKFPYQLGFIIIGATLYAHISAYSWVPTLAIAEGKWTFVFPQVYVSTRSSPPYLAGRCLASFASSTVTSIASLAIAVVISLLLFGVAIPLVVTPLSIVLFGLALVVNIFASMGLGFLLGAYAIFASRFEWALPTYVSGLLMVFSEALFPVAVLPWPLSAFGNVLPFTQFIRAAREAVVYGSVSTYSYYVAYCLLGGLLFLGVSLWAYRWAERQGRKKGIIDRKVV